MARLPGIKVCFIQNLQCQLSESQVDIGGLICDKQNSKSQSIVGMTLYLLVDNETYSNYMHHFVHHFLFLLIARDLVVVLIDLGRTREAAYPLWNKNFLPKENISSSSDILSVRSIVQKLYFAHGSLFSSGGTLGGHLVARDSRYL